MICTGMKGLELMSRHISSVAMNSPGMSEIWTAHPHG